MGLISPWHPITDALDLKHLGKLSEETNELGSAIARCIIQGIEESEPTTNKPNIEWLEDEIADVLANINLVSSHFELDLIRINDRRLAKETDLRQWHKMA